MAVASAGSYQVCTSLKTENHASTPPLSFIQAGCPSCHPANSIEGLKAPDNHIAYILKALFLIYRVKLKKTWKRWTLSLCSFTDQREYLFCLTKSRFIVNKTCNSHTAADVAVCFVDWCWLQGWVVANWLDHDTWHKGWYGPSHFCSKEIWILQNPFYSAVTSQLQSITALCLVLIFCPTYGTKLRWTIYCIGC